MYTVGVVGCWPLLGRIRRRLRCEDRKGGARTTTDLGRVFQRAELLPHTDFRCSGVVGLKGDSLGNHDHFTEGAAYGARDAGYRLRKASF